MANGSAKVSGLKVSDDVRAKRAFEKLRPQLVSLRAEDVVQVNLDISGAVQTILGALPAARALRRQILKELPLFDIASFDQLEDCALALSAAQTAYLEATAPSSGLEELTDEAIQLRETLERDAEALIRRNLIDGRRLADLKRTKGYKSIAHDLQLLSKLLLDAWPKIRGKVATTPDELRTASQMATRIVGLREHDPEQFSTANDTRSRAFTLLLRTYEDARRAAIYLRARQRDADTLLPSLYSGRRRPRQPEGNGPAGPNATTAPNETRRASVAVARATKASAAKKVNSIRSVGSAARKNGAAHKGPFQ